MEAVWWERRMGFGGSGGLDWSFSFSELFVCVHWLLVIDCLVRLIGLWFPIRGLLVTSYRLFIILW